MTGSARASECIYWFLHSLSKYFPRIDLLKRSDHMISCSEPSPASVENPNSLPPWASAHPQPSLLPQGLCTFFFSAWNILPDCPMSGSFLFWGTFSKGASWGLSSQTNLAMALHYFVFLPSALLPEVLLGQGMHFPGCRLFPTVDSEPERGGH